MEPTLCTHSLLIMKYEYVLSSTEKIKCDNYEKFVSIEYYLQPDLLYLFFICNKIFLLRRLFLQLTIRYWNSKIWEMERSH